MIDISAVEAAMIPFSAVAAKLFGRLCGPSCDEIGLIGGDGIRWFRTKTFASILERVQKVLDAKDIVASEIKPKILIPIMQAASLADDDWMKDRWADLIATAASPDEEVHPSYAGMLAELTAEEAQELQRLSSMGHFLTSVNGSVSPTPKGRVQMDNWVRLGIFEPLWEAKHVPGEPIPTSPTCETLPGTDRTKVERSYRLTELGASFLRACGVLN